METSCVWILWESWGITYIPKVKDKSWYLHHCSRHKAIIIVPKAAFFSPNQASWQESALKTMSETVQKMSKQQTTKLDDRKSWEWEYGNESMGMRLHTTCKTKIETSFLLLPTGLTHSEQRTTACPLGWLTVNKGPVHGNVINFQGKTFLVTITLYNLFLQTRLHLGSRHNYE